MKTVSSSIIALAALTGIVSAAPRYHPYMGISAPVSPHANYGVSVAKPGYNGGISAPVAPRKKCNLSCGNQGLKYSIFDNVGLDGKQIYNHYGESGDNGLYSNWDPAFFKSRSPKCQGVTTRVGFNKGEADPSFKFYDDAQPVRTDYVAINHGGYIFAPADGEYTFRIPVADEITQLWVGDDAISNWNRGNACLTNLWAQQGEQVFKKVLSAGSYTPIRIMFANAQGAAAFQLSVTGPGGPNDIIIDGNSNNQNLVRFSCDKRHRQFQ